MPFRLVHAADLHLDSPLRSLALRDEGLAALIGAAGRSALSAIVDLAIAKNAHALLIAGDLYDGAQTSMKTAGFLAAELARATDAGLRVFIIRGNHDATSRITRELTLPDGVHVFTGRGGTVTLPGAADGRDVAIHGVSFRDPHAPESLLPKYPAPVAGAINIGMMHTSLAGAEGHDNYAPVSLNALIAHGYEYWALGHIHKRQVLCERPAVVMPGIPQGRDMGELGTGSVTYAEIDADGSVRLHECPVATVEMARVDADMTGAEDWPAAAAAMEDALRTARAAAHAPQLVVRLRLTGASPMAWALRRDPERAAQEARARAARINGAWMEKLEITCTAPRAPGIGGPMDTFGALIEGEIIPSHDYREAAREAARDLMTRLPKDLKDDLLGADEAAENAALDALSAEGALAVLARLRGGRD
ncbi:MAG: DNA repair exonuclease SbcCD nuclease subunit [Paracoccaceae bacterium]|jgi:DNA repair exonuclease SbcCD nuclease subunit